MKKELLLALAFLLVANLWGQQLPYQNPYLTSEQ